MVLELIGGRQNKAQLWCEAWRESEASKCGNDTQEDSTSTHMPIRKIESMYVVLKKMLYVYKSRIGSAYILENCLFCASLWLWLQ